MLKNIAAWTDRKPGPYPAFLSANANEGEDAVFLDVRAPDGGATIRVTMTRIELVRFAREVINCA